MNTKRQIDLLLFLLLHKPQHSQLDLCFGMGLSKKDLNELFSHLLKEGDVELVEEHLKLNRTAASIKAQPKRQISEIDWKIHGLLHRSPSSLPELSEHIGLTKQQALVLLSKHQDRGFVFKKDLLYHSTLQDPQLSWVVPSKRVLPLESDTDITQRQHKRWGIFFAVCFFWAMVFSFWPTPQTLSKSELTDRLYLLSSAQPAQTNIQEQLVEAHIQFLSTVHRQQHKYCQAHWGAGETCFFMNSELTSQDWNHSYSKSEDLDQ